MEGGFPSCNLLLAPSYILCLLAVTQEAGEGFIRREEGERGDSAAGDGESEPDNSSGLLSVCFTETSHVARNSWSDTTAKGNIILKIKQRENVRKNCFV